MKIGVIACDVVRQSMLAEHGDYPQMVENMFAGLAGGAEPLGCDLSFEHYSAIDGRLPSAVTACDAFVLTGSRHAVYEPHPWLPPLITFIQACAAQSVPILGICFGHQLLAVALGGRAALHPGGWGVGVAQVSVLAEQPWMAPNKTQVGLLVSHRDQVQELPEGCTRLLGSKFCPNFMFVKGSCIGVQGHPEFSRPYLQALMSAREQCIPSDLYAQAQYALANEATDESVVVTWVLQFFRHRLRA